MVKGDQRKEDKDVLKRRKILEEPFKKVALEFVITSIIVVVLLYIGLLLISHTAGFRSLISERLSAEIGGGFEIEKSKLDFALNLHLKEIKSTGDPREFGRVHVESASGYWSLPGLISKENPAVHKIVVDGVSVLVVDTGEKGWKPEMFSVLKNVPGFGEPEEPVPPKAVKADGNAATEEVPAATGHDSDVPKVDNKLRAIVEVTNSQLNIIGAQGQRLANFGNLNFNYVPTFNEGLEVQLYELRGDYVLQNTRIPRQKIDIEVLHAGDEVVVRKLMAGAQMLMKLGKAFGGEDGLSDEVLSVIPPPEIPKPDPDPVPRPVVVVDADPLHQVVTRTNKVVVVPSDGDLPPIFVPSVARETKPMTTKTPKPRSIPEASPVPRPNPAPAIAPQIAVVPEHVVAAPKAADVPVIQPEIPAVPPRPVRPPPRIVSRTEVETRPGMRQDPAVIEAPLETKAKADEDVVSEIERVLKEALNVQVGAQRDREAALRKFATITNDFAVISNELERVLSEDIDAPPSGE